MTPTILGLYSSSPGNGKTTLANHLQPYGFRTVSFAGPLKEMTALFLTHLGYGPADARALVHTRKEDIIPQLGVTSRHLQRTLGTEWGRDCVHPDVWLKCWRERVQLLLDRGYRVVCDDVRFPNEAELIRSLGGRIWHVTRPGTTPASTHRSDNGLTDYPHFDALLINNGTLIDLYTEVGKRLQLTDIPEFDHAD
jgi:hypothetical protein